MKTREKIIIGVLIIILIVNVIVIAVMALGEKELQEISQEEAASAEWIEREDLPKTKTVVLSDEVKTEKKLTYDTSRKLEKEQVVDVYSDEDGTTYHYEEDRLVGIFKKGVDEKEDTSQKIDRKKAIDIAKKYLLETYGEDLSGYELDEIYGEGTSRIRIFFTKRYGKDGFVSGATISVTMTSTGEIHSSALPYKKYLDFNEDLLNGITLESVETFIEEQLKEKHGKDFHSFEFDFISVNYIEGKYCLEIGIEAIISDTGGKEWKTTESYRYALE